MSSKLMEYFNKQPRLGMLSTYGNKVRVDIAAFGSPRMSGEKIVFAGLGKNRSLDYLQQNPYEVYMIMEPGNALMDWKGVRVYLKMTDLVTSGPALDTYKKQLEQIAGEAAGMIHTGMTLEVIGVRPIVDRGQGREKSVQVFASIFPSRCREMVPLPCSVPRGRG